MIIRAFREPETGDWITTIPTDHWDDFYSYVREIRLPCRTQKSSKSGVTIRIADGLTRRDIEEHLDTFFDGIATVEVEVDRALQIASQLSSMDQGD